MHAACFRPPVEILMFNMFLVEYVFLIHYTFNKQVELKSGHEFGKDYVLQHDLIFS